MLRRILLAGVALLAVSAGVVAVVLWATRPPEPGAFYDPPAIGADAAAGALLRSESFPEAAPEGARAWRILYVTRGIDDQPIAVSGMVVAGAGPFAGPRPVVAWAHGTIGIERGCAATLLPDPALVVPSLDDMLSRGWVVAVSDYPGLGGPGDHPYLVGDVTGRAVIDSVRAARALDTGLEVGDRYAVWGESQGGHAALFAGEVASDGYAPELRLAGVAAAAPATDLGPLLTAAQGTPAGKVLTAQAVSSWSRVYPELDFDAAVARRARPAVRAIAGRCLFPDFFVVAAQTLLVPDPLLSIDIAADPLWSRRVAENTPVSPIAAPVIVAQGQRDVIVSPAVQRRYVQRRCRAGQALELVELPASGHIDVMRAAGPPMAEWTARLFAGEPVPRGCVTG